jgi:hypothetical protein
MAYEFILGVDVIHSESKALTVAFTAVEKTGSNNGEATRYRLRLLEEKHSFESTDDIAEHIQSLLTQKPYVARTVPMINQTTEEGQAVRDALEDRGLAPVGATLVDGTTTMSGNREEMHAVVSMRNVLDALRALQREGRIDLQVQKDTDEASRLMRAIEWFSESGTDEDGNEHRVDMALSPDQEGRYEPLVVSTALACWLGEEQTFDPTEHLKKDIQGQQVT